MKLADERLVLLGGIITFLFVFPGTSCFKMSEEHANDGGCKGRGHKRDLS